MNKFSMSSRHNYSDFEMPLMGWYPVNVSFMFWLLLCVGAFSFYFYKWSISTFRHFENLGVQFVKPLPLFGGSLNLLLARENILEYVNGMYSKFKGYKVYGNYEMRSPMLIIRDPEIIHQITVKDCDHFMNHRRLIDQDVDPLFGKNLFLMKDQSWKDMRMALSPIFTGSKIREMFNLLVPVAERAILHLKEHSQNGSLNINTKEISNRFTTDVIATTAFGLEVNSFKDVENEFYVMGKILSSSSWLFTLKILLAATFPNVARLLRIRLFPENVEKNFSQIVTETMAVRERRGIVRRDIIQILIQIKKDKILSQEEQNNNIVKSAQLLANKSDSYIKWSITDLVAQCFVFFFAGFDNVSLLMCFTIQELIENPKVQQRLYCEVDETMQQLDGSSLTYDVLHHMSYLDQVICETLRKWPLAAVTDRACTKPYILTVDGQQIPIEVNDVIQIPIYGIHRDPEIYENPEEYDPERFSVEKKHKINSTTYLPFGVGPRKCVAYRFALMEAKALIFYLLANFSFAATDQTQIPLKITKTSGFALNAEKGFHVQLSRRNLH